MTKPIIEVKNLSKAYRLGNLGAKSFTDDLRSLWNRFRGNEAQLDPNVLDQIKNEGDSGRINPDRKNEFWALQDINFEIQPGEVVGIIGHNGAGKSTLLKILSRITEPTTGEITIRGRVSSLLEVGTGFHPELTGRENTYLNGAIYGMSRKEIDTKFDEIVEFAKVEDFIDTPVKRYSSGMYVRLAFAVAAHLEPEILIVDEVLAVGDAAFQNKCITKMKSISESGRSILFVSHNLQSIRMLCERTMVIKMGRVFTFKETPIAINDYLANNQQEKAQGSVEFDANTQRYGTGEVRIKSLKVINSKRMVTNELMYKEAFQIVISCDVLKSINKCGVFLYFCDVQDHCVGMSYSSDSFPDIYLSSGVTNFIVKIETPLLPGEYFILPVITNHYRAIDQIQRAMKIKVSYVPLIGQEGYPASQVRSQMPLLKSVWEFGTID